MRNGLGRIVLCGLLASAVLAGCKSAPVDPKVEYRTANVAVAVGCVVNAPAKPPAINTLIPQDTWKSLAPGAKSQAVKAQAGERMNYQDQLEASTSGCRKAPGVGSPRPSSTGEPEDLLPSP